MNFFNIFTRNSPLNALVSNLRYTRKITSEKGHGPNLHRSNRAKRGLYHGKDVRFGNSISHSHAKTRRSWHPNVQNKRVWSQALNDWIRFQMTTIAIKKVDDYGGIDNYLLSLDEKSVQDSKYVTKQRNIVASILYHQGKLKPYHTKLLGFDKKPPDLIFPTASAEKPTKSTRVDVKKDDDDDTNTIHLQ
eukprot:gene25858-33797_t